MSIVQLIDSPLSYFPRLLSVGRARKLVFNQRQRVRLHAFLNLLGRVDALIIDISEHLP